LGSPRLNARIRNCLWKNNGNFEATFEDLRAAASDRADSSARDDFETFNAMLLEMYDAMKLGFRSAHIELRQTASLLRTDRFLAHFDAIFTLNQDTYLEQHYVYQPVHQSTHGDRLGIDIPGLKEPAPIIEHGNQLTKATVRYVLSEGFTLRDGWQPYIKLHGSYNWRSEGGHLLIVGGTTSIDIARIPLLTWYHAQFRSMITKPNTRLMIIGYGFGDEHINECLQSAARASTKLFIVDVLGADVLDRRPAHIRQTQGPTPLLSALRDSIVGASRRPLRDTLDHDPVELKKLVDFMQLKIKWVYDPL